MSGKISKSKVKQSSSKRSARVAPISMPLQPIKCCHRIDPLERMFLEAAERGDKPTMIRCLQSAPPVNVNCTNMIGRSAIQIAVDNENIEIVELLLKQDGVKIGDALLYAIREGVYKIVEMLIDHPSITPEMLGNEWCKSKYVEEKENSEESHDYSPDISPVILAAHCNQFEILQLLLMRGAVIDRPHQLSCSCRKCQEKVCEDGLRHSLRRINTYRALASPAWISLTSSDPILTAFKLSCELEKLALRENEFKDTYIELSNQCKKCACDLLDQCRSTEEVIAVLNKDNDSDSEDEDGGDEDENDHDPGRLTLSRLKLALKYQQKELFWLTKNTCNVLDQCRSTEEVIVVLNNDNDSDSEDEDGGEEDDNDHDPGRLTLSRLKLALKYQQKECRSTEEVIAVLNKDNDSDSEDEDGAEEDDNDHDPGRLTLSRLKLALKYQQKECQSTKVVISVLNKENDSDSEDEDGGDGDDNDHDPGRLTLSRLKLALKYQQKEFDKCRSTEEVIAVLNKDNDSDSEDEDGGEEDDNDHEPGRLTLSRLKLALKYQQKEFVAHPNCQQLLTSIWYEGLPSWRKRNTFSKFVICIGLILILPFMAFYYWVFPLSKLTKFVAHPNCQQLLTSIWYEGLPSCRNTFSKFVICIGLILILPFMAFYYWVFPLSKLTKFVAHPNCQQLLTSIWYEGLPSWRKRNTFSKFVICIGLILILPFMAFYYWVFPLSKVGQILRSPFMKFLYHSASFVVFLILLICASTEVSSLTNREKLRGPPPTELEWLICIWVTGFIWSECKQLWEEGLKAYIRQWWNWLDFIMLSLYLTTFTLRFVAYIQIETGRYGPRELDRQFWPILDPTMVSEGLFAIANVFSFARLIFLFQADQYLGPLQISLGCMLIDIAKFLFIFFLVLTSFACGLNQLYWYYNPSAEGNPSAFYTLESSYRTLYWSLFSLTQVKDIRIEGGQTYTENVGELLFMAYHGMAIIVLINMLIAMMSNSFQEIENHADMEWKFSRSKLWMGYFDEGSTLPPPFNLVISPKSILYFVNATREIFCACCLNKESHYRRRQRSFDGNIKTKESSSTTLNHEMTDNYRPSFNGDIGGFKRRNDRPIPRTKYQDIMRRLVTRYIHQTKKQRRQDGVNEDDLLEIKQDISSLRYEIREDRIRETKITENRLDSLRCDILFALRNGYHDNHKIRPPPYGLASSVQNTQNTQNNHNQPIEFVHTVHTQAPSESSTATAQNEDQPYVSNNRDQGLYKADINQRPSNYSVTRVANYISHLGDSFSSQMTDTFPPIHHISDNPSPAYDTDAHAQYSRGHSPNYSVIRPVVLRAKDNEEIVNKAQSSSDKLLTRKDVESIKLEILSALKTEIQDTAKEVASDILNLSTSGSILPTISSELYQTHLYTQL